MRYLLLTFLLLLANVPLRPCSCALPPYQTLCAAIDSAQADNQNIVVVRVTGLSGRFADMRIERELAGSAPLQDFTFRRGNGADCGIPLTEATVGSRYLAFLDLEEERSEYTGFQCGYRYNMFPIVDGAIEYGNDLAAIQAGGPQHLYFDLAALEGTGGCLPFTRFANLADGLRLWPNPTPGTLRLDTLRTVPPVFRLELFDVTGRRLKSWSATIEFPFKLDLNRLPAGVYFLRVFADRQREVFRIVKT